MNGMQKIHDRRSVDKLAAGQYSVMEVDDPYEAGSRIRVDRQTRCDPLGRLHAHRQIDDAQYSAGRHYQREWERAERGARAIDPTKEAVDGGLIPEPLTDGQISARARLIRVNAILGRRLEKLLYDVLIAKQSIREITGSELQTILKSYGSLFRHGLDELAQIYGYSNGRRK